MAIVNKHEAAIHVDPTGKFVTDWTIFRWYSRENMPCIRAGRRVLFNTDSIDRWLHERERGLQDPTPERGMLRRIE